MDAWELVRTYADGIAYHSGVIFNNRANLLCGASGGTALSIVIPTPNGRVFDTVIQNPPGLPVRGRHASCVFDGRVFVIGGANDTVSLADVLVTEDFKSWETLFTGPNGLIGHRLVAFGTPQVKLVLLGGYVTDVTEYIVNIQTSSDGRNWTLVNTIGDVWSGREGFGCLVYKNKLWVFGGLGEVGGLDQCFNDVWWTDDLIHWHQAPDAPWHARSHFGYCIWDERMWVIAGKDYVGRTNVPHDDVWFTRDGSTWEQAFTFPTHLRDTYADVIDNKIHVFGGAGNENSVYRMNLG